MDIDRLRSFVEGFSFDKCYNGGQGFIRILIQLFGFLGHGKSSFINTCMYVWEDKEYKDHTESSDDLGGSTTRRNTYLLNQCITLVDNRGFSTMDGYETGEIFAQLGNLLPLDRDVKWTKEYELLSRMAQAERVVKTSDFIVPVFVYSVKKSIEPEESGEIKATLTLVKDLTGIMPFVVLTHKTSGKLTERTNEFRNMGIEKIFSFENYTLEDHFKTRGRHEELMKFLYEIIKEVQFQVSKPRDPEREMRKRRRFVTTYVNEREKIMKTWEQDKQNCIGQPRDGRNQGQPQKHADHKKQRKRRSEEDAESIYESMRQLSLGETANQHGWDMRSPRRPRQSDEYRVGEQKEYRHNEHPEHRHNELRQYRLDGMALDRPREKRPDEHREYGDGEFSEYKLDRPREYRQDGPREYRLDGPREYRWDEPREYNRDGPREYSRDGPRENSRDGPIEYRQDGPREYRRDEPIEYRRDELREYRQDGPIEHRHEEQRECRYGENRKHRDDEHTAYRYVEHRERRRDDEYREHRHGQHGEYSLEQRQQRQMREKYRRYQISSEIAPNIYEGIN